MKERPILFSGAMVRALLDGSKTQTRRVVKPQPHAGVRRSVFAASGLEDGHGRELRPRHGVPGDRLWVRETWHDASSSLHSCALYRADGIDLHWDKWTPSIHMPRWASRITLEVTGVRAERLQDISEADAKAEGIFTHVRGGWHWLQHDSSNPDDWNQFGYKTAALAFQALWETINGANSWDANPWVWAMTFRRLP